MLMVDMAARRIPRASNWLMVLLLPRARSIRSCCGFTVSGPLTADPGCDGGCLGVLGTLALASVGWFSGSFSSPNVKQRCRDACSTYAAVRTLASSSSISCVRVCLGKGGGQGEKEDSAMRCCECSALL